MQHALAPTRPFQALLKLFFSSILFRKKIPDPRSSKKRRTDITKEKIVALDCLTQAKVEELKVDDITCIVRKSLSIGLNVPNLVALDYLT
jgi:hypothetical protein